MGLASVAVPEAAVVRPAAAGTGGHTEAVWGGNRGKKKAMTVATSTGGPSAVVFADGLGKKVVAVGKRGVP